MAQYTNPGLTIDRVPVTVDLRVFTYDYKWGTVEAPACSCQYSAAYKGSHPTSPLCEHWDGWWNVANDDGSRGLMDGTRMWAHGDPRANKPDPQAHS
jgi:hypothetical protein